MSLPLRRVVAGDVVQFGASRHVVLSIRGENAAICDVIGPGETRHRADLALGWPDTLQLGIATQSVIRCAPRVFRFAHRLEWVCEISMPLMRRIQSLAAQEIAIQRDEDAWASQRERVA